MPNSEAISGACPSAMRSPSRPCSSASMSATRANSPQLASAPRMTPTCASTMPRLAHSQLRAKRSSRRPSCPTTSLAHSRPIASSTMESCPATSSSIVTVWVTPCASRSLTRSSSSSTASSRWSTLATRRRPPRSTPTSL